ncbi:hypothetical protein HYC85_028683 [Camellia sinensis]|uniref:Protein kinase domain-containing protein n=1 Tax=Camellia sinensis TaxID=4442 RepID=A0A7J7FVZ2_CAMSI|nr:hypothetical protein HYC85_028683 [Camellia sinensis]
MSSGIYQTKTSPEKHSQTPPKYRQHEPSHTSTIDPHLPSVGRMPRSLSVLHPRCQASRTHPWPADPLARPHWPGQLPPALPESHPVTVLPASQSRGVTRVPVRNSIDQLPFQQDSQKPKDPINILESRDNGSSGTLADWIKKSGGRGLPESDVRHILEGLDCIHSSGYVHHALKLENIIIVSISASTRTEYVAKVVILGWQRQKSR